MEYWMAERLHGQRNSIFEEINAVARRHDAVNLGVGTPDAPLPDLVRAAAVEAMANHRNQYSPIQGELALRVAIAAHAARFYGQEIDPDTEVTVTSGVTEGMHAAIFSFIEAEDEVIVFEPFYNSYVPSIRLAGGIPVPVTLHSPGFRFEPQQLRGVFSQRTKALILNSPHNPTGTVFSREELSLIAELCQEHDVLAITDEVYEHIIFDGEQQLRLATFPGMWERTLTLGGAGKTFSCTGWRIGWAIGPAPLHEALNRLRQLTVFASATPFQFAIAEGLAFPDSYFHELATGYQARRDRLAPALAACGLKPTNPAGGFFILADFAAFQQSEGMKFCCDLAENFGVVPVPTDTFYLNPRHGAKLVRFAFCVGMETLELAVQRLARFGATFGLIR
jgi:N-succinyldiaminopimelate aminotransferase